MKRDLLFIAYLTFAVITGILQDAVGVQPNLYPIMQSHMCRPGRRDHYPASRPAAAAFSITLLALTPL